MYKWFLGLVFISFSVAAQVPEPAILWLKGYGGNLGEQVSNQLVKTQDGGFVVTIGSNSNYGTGNLDSFCTLSGTRNIYLKYNADASLIEWSKCSNKGSIMFPQTDGSFIYGGNTNTTGWAYQFIKEDATGVTVITKTYGASASAIMYCMIATKDKGFLMLGETNYTDSDVLVHYGSWMNPDLCVIKVDSVGNKQWSRVLGGSGYDNAIALVEAPGNGCYVVGGSGSNDHDCVGSHGGADVFIARLDSVGNTIWSHVYGGSGDDSYNGWATANGDGGLIVAAGSESTDGDVHNNHGGFDYWVLNVDSTGHIVWDNSYGGIGSEYALSVCKSTDGSIWLNGYSGVAGGEVDTTYGATNAWIVHVDAVGNFLSAKVLGGTDDDWGQMIYPLSNNMVIAGGYYTRNNGNLSALPAYSSSFYSDVFLAVFVPWTTKVNEVIEKKFVTISPNPATNLMKFSFFDSLGDPQIVRVEDLTGREIYTGKVQDRSVIDVSRWQRGTYVLSITSTDGEVTRILQILN